MGCRQSAESIGFLASATEVVIQKPALLHSSSTATNLTCTTTDVDSTVPVKLCVFDLDETLTIKTFMPLVEKQEAATKEAVEKSFESPWSGGQRLEQLRRLFKELAHAALDGAPRALAVLTRNTRGIEQVFEFLQAAGLEQHLYAIWNIPYPANLSSEEQAAGLEQQLGMSCQTECTGDLQLHSQSNACNGAYRDGSEWHYFSAPFLQIPACRGWISKADVFHHLVANPQAWFPQLASDGCGLQHLEALRMENIVLVDDDPANFKSPATGLAVQRRCLVHRFEAEYKDIGRLRVGGIGSRSEADYVELQKFVEGTLSGRMAPALADDTEEACFTL
eukprot:TRINITY_DN45498_c0_g1_i1.p1 TRINITY_DN45498_c0_g1~~TRINITY_DN45498_c0_g1_i1.p1  ORF type:complete len:335 (+),score=62.94 TRINITY_DN45498_c0_g1_i1:51-1055(+)